MLDPLLQRRFGQERNMAGDKFGSQPSDPRTTTGLNHEPFR
jgi:hypothetical protein